ncbi:MAG: hypothetical protein HUU55_06775, partial [Myxococcales bacterium]|nr:hypothetical protein [Myxococcales bacterium]
MNRRTSHKNNIRWLWSLSLLPWIVALSGAALTSGCGGGAEVPAESEVEMAKQTASLEGAIDPATCISKLLNGDCQSQAAWQTVADNTCAASGQVATPVSLTSPCATGGFKRASFQCCQPSTPCKTSTILGICQTQAQLMTTAANQCMTMGLTLATSSFSNPCPNGTFRRIDFECCPGTPEVCCKTTAGFQVLPATQCPAALQAPMDMCMGEVCCKLATGPVFVPAGQCPAASILPDAECQPAPEVCCQTAAGFQVVPATQCPTTLQVPMDMCVGEVCCKLATGPVFVPAAQCPAASILPDAECQPAPEVCCQTAAGFQVVPA